MKKKYVLVTGASAGIGEAIVDQLDKRGFSVFGTVRTDEDAKKLEVRTNGRIQPVHMDITQVDTIASARTMIQNVLGDAGLYGLVNNAGSILGGPVEFQALEEVRGQIEVNLIGHIAVIQAFLPLLRLGHGRIVNVGSGLRFGPTPFVAAYCAAKTGLAGFTDVLRMELRPWSLPVIMVDPGATDTPVWDSALPKTEEVFKQLPERDQQRYHTMLYNTGKFYEGLRKQANTPQNVARVVARALTARRPRHTYLSG